jgi:hypothetical protein
VCFAETFLRNPPVRILALDDLAGRSIATVEVRRDLRFVPIHGSSLARLGVTAELASGTNYVGSQLWSRAQWEHSPVRAAASIRNCTIISNFRAPSALRMPIS